ncbi:MAG: DHH family phosphoesterase [Methanobrevibacter sp.]|jgi:RecJ-like exonuclease|nr:DHH family phosphoesterase [Methanobrevibacter sp.]
MKKSCSNCKGTGSQIKDTKICDACDGTGFQETFETKNHFKGVNSNAKAKFDLEMDQDIPCEVCKGKGTIDIYEECSYCNGSGEINVCKSCGKLLNDLESEEDYCKDCKMKIKEKEKEKEKLKKESIKSTESEESLKSKEKTKVYVLDSLCDMDDLEIGNIYKGKITKIERFGAFVSLNNQVWGLMRGNSPGCSVGDEIFGKITEIKPHKKNPNKKEVDMSPVPLINNYEIIKLKKSINRTQIANLNTDTIGNIVKIQGEIIQIQQTSGPTIFTVTDETAITWIAAFDEAGVRSYPNIENGDIVEVIGEVNQHSGKVQIESETIEKLEDGDNERKNQGKEIAKLIEKAIDERAEPEETEFLIKSPILDKLKPKMRLAAKTIRRAILDGRTVLLRHHADADGICAGIAIEKAVLPLLEEMSPSSEAQWHYFRRSPSKAPFYEIEDVVKDLSFALEDQERHGQKLPLIVLLDNGSTEEDVLALMKVKIYDIETVVIDHHFPGELEYKEGIEGENKEDKIAKAEVDEYVDVHVNPYLVGGDSQITAGALAVEVANIINPNTTELIKHLPGIAALGDHANSDEAEQYISLASQKNYSREDLSKIADCIDFEAYYLRFMNGRGIMDTILGVDNLDKHKKLIDALFKEYEKRVNTQLKAVLPNIKETKLPNGIIFNILDVEKYSHKFTFPAPGKTCGFVHDSIAKKYSSINSGISSNINNTNTNNNNNVNININNNENNSSENNNIKDKNIGDKPIITLAYGPDFGVIRATEAVNKIFGFNLNEIIWKLQDLIPEAGIDGGGHECAGSIKFLQGLSKEVLSSFADEIAKMK